MSLHPRIRRSREAFEAAALAAARTDPEAVTVTSLCEDWALNRGTFYLHYRDLDDLLASTVESLARRAPEARQEEAPLGSLGLNSQSRAAFGSYLAHIQEHRDFYRWALVTRGSQRAVNAATSVYIEGISAGLAKSSENGKSTRELQRRAAYLAGAMTGVIRQWLSDDPAESAAELSDWLWRELTVAKE